MVFGGPSQQRGCSPTAGFSQQIIDRVYAYVSIERRPVDLVRLPDGSQTVVDRGRGADFVATWREQLIGEHAACAKPTDREGDERPSQEQYLAAYADYEQALAAWRSELARDLDNALSVTHAREIKTRLGPSRPQPPQHPDGEAVAEAGERAAVPWPEVEETSWWLAIGPLPDQRASLAPASSSFPRAKVADVLTRLERDGWTTIHVSETRSVQHSDATSVAILDGASFLLHRQSERDTNQVDHV